MADHPQKRKQSNSNSSIGDGFRRVRLRTKTTLPARLSEETRYYLVGVLSWFLAQHPDIRPRIWRSFPARLRRVVPEPQEAISVEEDTSDIATYEVASIASSDGNMSPGFVEEYGEGPVLTAERLLGLRALAPERQQQEQEPSGINSHLDLEGVSLPTGSPLSTEPGNAQGMESSRSANIKPDGDKRVLLLQLQRRHYDAIMQGRKVWEARPIYKDDTRNLKQSIFDQLAMVGRVVVLQSGAGTNDRMRIAEVRRYIKSDKRPSLVRDMVVELGTELLPDTDAVQDRVDTYINLYGTSRCQLGFVAMRLEWPIAP